MTDDDHPRYPDGTLKPASSAPLIAVVFLILAAGAYLWAQT